MPGAFGRQTKLVEVTPAAIAGLVSPTPAVAMMAATPAVAKSLETFFMFSPLSNRSSGQPLVLDDRSKLGADSESSSRHKGAGPLFLNI